jgi:ribosome-binding protein aMBF1 (putative translation factor)
MTTLSSVFMSKPTVVMVILKDVLKSAREKQGLCHEELATAVCLKKWHIKEMEETENVRAFYSASIKLQAAKRIGAYLGLKESEYLNSEIS